HGDDLAVGKAGLLHGTSSGKGTRKFHFWRLLMRGGITFECAPRGAKPQMTIIQDRFGLPWAGSSCLQQIQLQTQQADDQVREMFRADSKLAYCWLLFTRILPTLHVCHFLYG
ncbi:hypothetical protein, partial [Xanthomonas citri]|uniref:hypothetical protein n=1 Tax=Xanthomonas citri TaxID=346 RepID=UPI001A8F1231